MADDSYWYGSADGLRVSLYVPPGWQVPSQLELVDDRGNPISLRRISAGLWCGTGRGEKGLGCRSRDCHTRELGACQCGRHTSVKLTPAPHPDGAPAVLAPSSLANQLNL